MKFLYRITLVVFLINIFMVPVVASDIYKVDEQQFFESLNDLPLMPGLYELIDEAVVFDKLDGRFIESQAASDSLSPDQIRGFYEQTLPQIGWKRIGESTFSRQEEELQMEVKNQDGFTVVRFTVEPRYQ